MAEQKIILTIDEEGGIAAETHGFKGETCIDALEALLGEVTISSVKTTDEYRQKVTVVNQIKVHKDRR